MKLLLLAGLFLFCATLQADESKVPPALNFLMKGLDGKSVNLAQYEGKVVLFVNVASQCGLTPQYKGLQELYTTYKKDGLVIIGVPANEFGAQEPGSDKEIATFCEQNYGVTFPMLSKVVVKGEGQCDLYKFLTSEKTNPKFAGEIRWNFTKFLVNRKGEVIERFEPRTAPEDMKKAIEAAIKK